MMTNTMNAATGMVNGWGKPNKSRTFHYFTNSNSICGKWSFFGRNETGVPMQKRCKGCESHRPAGAF
jgi:hypothetical protein